MKTQIALIAALLAACSDSPTQGPDETEITATHSAYVEIENNRPALYIQGPNDSAPRRIHFTGDAEDFPGSSPQVPKLTDANILALHSPRWSPDGTQLAFVASTAFDQAEVVVVDVQGAHARVVSINSQYVMGDADWSPNGKLLVYPMSTLPGAQGLDLFVSDLDARTVQRITTASGYSGLGGTVRFDATGNNVYFSKVTREEAGAPFNYITDIRRVGASGGAITTVASDIVGSVQSIERSGAGVLIMRNTAWPSDGNIPRELSRVSLNGSAPRVLAAGTNLQFAHLTSDDAFALLLSASKPGYEYQILPISGGSMVALRSVGEGSSGLDSRIAPR